MDIISEERGCDIIHDVFRWCGYELLRNVPFSEAGVDFEIDGWDPLSRIGFEFMTEAAGDYEDLNQDEFELLAARVLRGELDVLVIESRDVKTEQELVDLTYQFIHEVEQRKASLALQLVEEG